MSDHKLNALTAELTAALRDAGRDFSAHSIFSPSGSSMWAYCSGSLIPNLFAKDSAGEDAAYGTIAHMVGETWLNDSRRPDHLIGTTHEVKKSGSDDTFKIEVDIQMMDFVEEYVSWCMYLPGVHFVETRVDFSDLTPLKRQTGTADHAACQHGVLTITDLKMGRGIQVFAKENTQAVLYAYGFFRAYDELFDFQRIVIRIAQPRLGHFDVWEISREDLLERAAWLRKRAYAAWCKDAERTPGEKQCTFCKVKSDCAAFAVFAQRLSDGMFDNLDDPITSSDMAALKDDLDGADFGLSPVGVGALNTEQKAKIMRYRSMIESWFSDIYADLDIRIKRGESVPGFKLVLSRTNRKFKNVERAAEELEFYGLADEVIHPRGMITPAQAEDALRKVGYKRKILPDLLEPLVTKPEGQPCMVPDNDKRQAIASIVDQSFDNLEEL